MEAATLHEELIRRRGLKQTQDRQKDGFVAVLRSCTRTKDPTQGSRIHDAIISKALLESCSLDALVTMYAKCGALSKAKQVFGSYKSTDVVTWTALISGCTHKGQELDALAYFKRMQFEGLSPNAVTFSCVLKACAAIGAIDEGEKIHDEIKKQELLRNNLVLGTSLVDMYAKCSALSKAQKVLQELPARNVVCWTALIAGYAQHGEGDQALTCFEQMQREGHPPNPVTFICILKACGSIGALDKGEKFHDEIAKQGWLITNSELGTALVDMYAKCHAIAKAQQVLLELPNRNVVAWTALIAAYVQHGEGVQALKCFVQMRHEGIHPNIVTYLCVLKACGSIRASDKGQNIYNEIVKQGLLGTDVLLGNALVDMYVKCGALAKARRVLEELFFRNTISWTTLIAGYAEQGKGAEALNCFEEMQHEGLSPNAVTYMCVLKACGSIRAIGQGSKIHEEIIKHGFLSHDVALHNAVADMYANCAALAKARQVVEDTPTRDVISWNVLIGGFAEQGNLVETANCFKQMQSEGIFPNAATFNCILKACGSSGEVEWGERIHDEIAKYGLQEINPVLGNAVVSMYSRCGALAKAQEVVNELPARDVISWNALIGGYAKHGLVDEALNCLDQMGREGLSPDILTFIGILKACGSLASADKGQKIHDVTAKQGLLGRSVLLGTALVDMYAKCGDIGRAKQLFEELHVRDVISWTALIVGYTQQGEGWQALDCYEQMLREGLSPNLVTFISILKACGSIGAIDKGEGVHKEIAEQGLLESNVALGCALVDMYAKCGILAKARQVLLELTIRDINSWNRLIAGYVEHCKFMEVLNCFEHMQREGPLPDATTLSLVLGACSHAGLIEFAQTLSLSMSTRYGIMPDVEHHTCMIDLLGRSGHLDKAIAFIQKTCPSSPAILYALLGACHKWGDVDVGTWAFELAMQVKNTKRVVL